MQKRDALLYTLLAVFVPFALLYWFYVVAKDIQRAYGIKSPPILMLLAPIIGMVLGALSVILLAASSKPEGTGFLIAIFFITILLIIPLSILSYVYMYMFSVNVEKATGKELDRVLVFILFFFISPAAVYIVQDKLNKLTDSQPVVPTNGTF